MERLYDTTREMLIDKMLDEMEKRGEKLPESEDPED